MFNNLIESKAKKQKRLGGTFWAIALHRFGNWRMDVHPRIIRLPFSTLYKVLYKVVEWTCGISLNYPTRVGRRGRRFVCGCPA